MKLMMPFMKEKLRKKFVLCDGKDVLARLGGDPANVPTYLGGTREEHLQQLLDMFPELNDVNLAATDAMQNAPTPHGK